MDRDLSYLKHYGFLIPPFQGLSDRRLVWLGEKHLEILAHLKVGIEERKGILILTGDDGAGKSVLFERLLTILSGDFLTAILREPHLSVPEFFEFTESEFRIEDNPESASHPGTGAKAWAPAYSKAQHWPPAASSSGGLRSSRHPSEGNLKEAPRTKADFLIRFQAFLAAAYSAGKRVLLVVEGGQDQDDDVLEQIRLLSNYEKDGEKLLTVLLIGNHRLIQRLMEHRHRALLQRAAVRCTLEPFAKHETAAYIRHRMMAAGRFMQIFSPKAARAIHEFTRGNPRFIDIVCDHVLMRGHLEGQQTITGKAVDAYTREIRRACEAGADLSLLQDRPVARKQQKRRLAERQPFLQWPQALTLAFAVLAIVGVMAWQIPSRQTPEPPALFSPLKLYFPAGKTELSGQDRDSLRRIAMFMLDNPATAAMINGYYPSKKGEAISRAQADTLKSFLVRQKVDPARIHVLSLPSDSSTRGVEKPDRNQDPQRVDIELVPLGVR